MEHTKRKTRKSETVQVPYLKRGVGGTGNKMRIAFNNTDTISTINTNRTNTINTDGSNN